MWTETFLETAFDAFVTWGLWGPWGMALKMFEDVGNHDRTSISLRITS
jgi:hypothetical protein